MKVLVCGGRDYPSRANVFRYLDDLQRRLGGLISHVITGGATGADAHAEAWGEQHNVQVVICPANWNVNGRAAGPMRNSRMLQLLAKAQDDKGLTTSDIVVAFAGDKGTRDMTTKARAAGFTVLEPDAPQPAKEIPL